ncbi:MAG: ferritin [Acidobacteriota bacterium]
MPSKKLEQAINAQIQRELYSSYLYLAMSIHCEEINLDGFAHWMRLQSSEERGHSMKLLNYLHNRGGRVVLEVIAKPPSKFRSPKQMFQEVLKSEQSVTKEINKLYEMAKKEGDHATEVELQWFVQEQVEEEKTAKDILAKLDMVGDQPAALLMMDRSLGSRGQQH